jgi:hypothetical protein
VEITLEMTANSARLSQISACVEAKSGTKDMAGDSTVESLHDRSEKRAERDKWTEIKMKE